MNHVRAEAVPGHARRGGAPAAGRYGAPAVALHWLVAALVLVGLGWYMVEIPRGTPERAEFYNLHKSIGLTAALFIVLRIGWRWRHPAPPPAAMPQWQVSASRWSHRLLYLCMVAMPLSGYIASNFSKYGVKFYGLLAFEPWGPEDKAIYAFFNGIHVFTSYLFVALIALHLAAALKHLLVDRDGVFQRMLPGR